MENHPEKNESNIVLLFENDLLRPQAEKLAHDLSLEMIYPINQDQTTHGSKNDFFLTITKSRLELRIGGTLRGAIFVDFGNDALQFRLKQSSRKKEKIARAVGLKKNKTPIVFDLTAGMGRDAYILASMGCHVHLFERNKIMAALLADGLARANKLAPNGPTSLMTLHQGDALNKMQQVAQDTTPEVIYLDPMFPHRRKSALVKKEMRIIRALVGDDKDANTLLTMAKKIAVERVVCKRPKEAAPLCLSQSRPTMSIKSKKHRFDVYINCN